MKNDAMIMLYYSKKCSIFIYVYCDSDKYYY